MTDIKLLPLPNSGSGFYEDNVWHDTFSKRQMEACALANMEPLIAENERLRAERDSFQRVGIAAQDRAVRLAEALKCLNSATRRYMEERPVSDAEWASDEPSVLSIVDAALGQEEGK